MIDSSTNVYISPKAATVYLQSSTNKELLNGNSGVAGYRIS